MSGTLFDECREGDGNFLFGWEVNPVPVREGGMCDVELFDYIKEVPPPPILPLLKFETHHLQYVSLFDVQYSRWR